MSNACKSRTFLLIRAEMVVPRKRGVESNITYTRTRGLDTNNNPKRQIFERGTTSPLL